MAIRAEKCPISPIPYTIRVSPSLLICNLSPVSNVFLYRAYSAFKNAKEEWQ